MENKLKFEEVLKKHSVLGVVGNRSSAKTSMILDGLLDVKQRYPDINIAVMGVNDELHSFLESRGFTILKSKMDILDLRMKKTIIFVDEMAMFFDTRSMSKQLNKLMNFFDRIEHLNCKFIFGTAREGYFNKFVCSRVTAFLVKEIEYEALVNGTWLRERVKAIVSNSDYRLELPKSDYFLIAKDQLTTRYSFAYNKDIDTKKTNDDFFVTKNMKNMVK